MWRVVNPKETVPFIPECERDQENPTTFYVRAMTLRESVTLTDAARGEPEGGLSVPFEAIYNMLVKCIDRIENGIPGVESVADFLDCCSTPEGIGVVMEVFKFIQGMSVPNKAEAGN